MTKTIDLSCERTKPPSHEAVQLRTRVCTQVCSAAATPLRKDSFTSNMTESIVLVGTEHAVIVSIVSRHPLAYPDEDYSAREFSVLPAAIRMEYCRVHPKLGADTPPSAASLSSPSYLSPFSNLISVSESWIFEQRDWSSMSEQDELRTRAVELVNILPMTSMIRGDSQAANRRCRFRSTCLGKSRAAQLTELDSQACPGTCGQYKGS